MIKQFFGKEYWYLLAILAAIFSDSILSYVFDLGSITLVIYFVLILVIALKRLEWGIVIAFLELFSNPHGKLIFTDVGGFTLTLRMIVFGAVMLAWLIAMLRKKIKIDDLNRVKPFLVLIIAVALGFVGVLLNPVADAINDGNAYLYLAYLLPILSISWTNERKRLLLQTLAAGATWTIFLSFGILYLYTHFHEVQLESVYIFLRDIRVAEITNIAPSLYRVFIQSQFFVIVFASLLLGFFFEKLNKKESNLNMLLIAFSIAIVVLGLSRSFWVGLAVGLLAWAGLVLSSIRPNVKQIASASLKLIVSAIASLLLVAAVILFPFPSVSDSFDFKDVLRSRTASDAGITSRWKLLEPMKEGIAQEPFLGQGFGYSVTFQTDDPRARAINPDGTWTTYALEWGWLELWLKMGIFGPLGFIFIFFFLIRSLSMQLQGPQRWLAMGLIASLAFLAATHIFSPYLNHPIGLGFLMFVFIFADTKPGPVVILEKVKESFKQKKPSLAISFKSENRP